SLVFRALRSFPTRRSSDLAVHDVELGLLEWRSDLVLDHFDAGFVADDLVAFFDGADAADVEPHRRVELERVAARGGFGVAEHDRSEEHTSELQSREKLVCR